MALRGYTLSETQAPFPLCLHLGVWGGRCCRKRTMDGHYVLCPRVISGVNSRFGGVIWLRIDAAHFSCSLSECATVPADQTGPHPKAVALTAMGFSYDSME